VPGDARPGDSAQTTASKGFTIFPFSLTSQRRKSARLGSSVSGGSENAKPRHGRHLLYFAEFRMICQASQGPPGTWSPGVAVARVKTLIS